MERLLEEETVEEKLNVVKEAVIPSCQQVLGATKWTHKDWISTETLEKLDDRTSIERLPSTTVAPARRKSDHRQHAQRPINGKEEHQSRQESILG